jgi:hypothetical protein
MRVTCAGPRRLTGRPRGAGKSTISAFLAERLEVGLRRPRIANLLGPKVLPMSPE